VTCDEAALVRQQLEGGVVAGVGGGFESGEGVRTPPSGAEIVEKISGDLGRRGSG
jgi:hypothetical protein